MATFLDLQTRVQRRLIDAPDHVLAEVPDLINEALKSLQDAHDFKVMENQKTYRTVANANLLVDSAAPGTIADNVPLDFKSFRKKQLYRDSLGRFIPLDAFTDIQEVRLAFGAAVSPDFSNVGSPKALVGGGFGFNVVFPSSGDPLHRRFEIWPASDSNSDFPDGEYLIFVLYWYFLADLVADNDTNWFLTQKQTIQYIIRKAVAEGFLLDWDEERAGVWEARATQALNEAKITDKMYRLATFDTIVPYRGVNAIKVGV